MVVDTYGIVFGMDGVIGAVFLQCYGLFRGVVRCVVWVCVVVFNVTMIWCGIL